MVYRGLEAVSRHRVIVGHATREAGGVFYSRTPQLVDRMTRIDLNPRWRVPSGILKLELDKQSAAWRKRRRYRIYGQGARRRAIQLPGPANVMGRAKFVLANKRGIFLHDTKDRYMFEWKDRARSHGCIRVDGAERLARMLIEQDTPGPDPLIDEALRGWKTTSWELSRPIPVVIDYNTVVVDADGTVRIVEDVYGWDQPGAMAALRTVRFAAKQRRRALRRRLERAGESTVQRRQAIR